MQGISYISESKVEKMRLIIGEKISDGFKMNAMVKAIEEKRELIDFD